MTPQDRWLLPEGIEELLPPQAQHLEQLRRAVLDLYRAWGYEMVIPPLIEYLESLLTGMGSDLDLQTFKITDQLTGRMMGVRADMTPQVARIDAHRLKRNTPTRLCYLGSVLHTHPDGFGSSRSPLQTGAELYGHAGIEADVEVMCLMLATLRLAGVESIYLDLGHMGIFRGLTAQAGLDSEREGWLFGLLQRKAVPELRACLEEWRVEPRIGGMFLALVDLNGDAGVLDRARAQLRGAGRAARRAIDELERIGALLATRAGAAALHFDLAELRGYHYHTGVMFAAYRPGQGQALALGGRYDEIGRVFGRARPATGFSTDLLGLAGVGGESGAGERRILAPHDSDPSLLRLIARLRSRGEIVVTVLPGQRGNTKEMGRARRIEKRGGKWQVVRIT